MTALPSDAGKMPALPGKRHNPCSYAGKSPLLTAHCSLLTAKRATKVERSRLLFR